MNRSSRVEGIFAAPRMRTPETIQFSTIRLKSMSFGCQSYGSDSAGNELAWVKLDRTLLLTHFVPTIQLSKRTH